MYVPAHAEAAQHIYSSLGFTKDKDLGKPEIAPGGYDDIQDWVRKL